MPHWPPAKPTAEKVGKPACRRLKPTPTDKNKRLGRGPEGPHYANVAFSVACKPARNGDFGTPKLFLLSLPSYRARQPACTLHCCVRGAPRHAAIPGPHEGRVMSDNQLPADTSPVPLAPLPAADWRRPCTSLGAISLMDTAGMPFM